MLYAVVCFRHTKNVVAIKSRRFKKEESSFHKVLVSERKIAHTCLGETWISWDINWVVADAHLLTFVCVSPLREFHLNLTESDIFFKMFIYENIQRKLKN